MFPEAFQYHIADEVNIFVKWINVAWGPFFEANELFLNSVMVNIKTGLLYVPWWLYIIILTLLAWKMTRHVGKTVIPAVLILGIGGLGLWTAAMDTLAVIIVAVVVSLLIGIPLGVAMAVSNKVNAILTPILDAMQTMPSLVWMIPAMMLLGLGKPAAVLATVIYALPPVQRLTNLGIRQVSESVQEAAMAFGATPWQLMKEVRLPLAMPSILAGVNQTTMMALAMVVLCSMIGAGGVGERVLVSLNRCDSGKGLEAGLVIVAMAIIIDRFTQQAAGGLDTTQKK